MTVDFEAEQSITLGELYFKDNSDFNDGDVTYYKIEYHPYFDLDDTYKYTYETTDATTVEELQAGVYLDLADFSNGDDSPAEIADNCYSITVTITADGIDSTGTKIYNFYQGILNKYSQKSLKYDWTDRYKEDRDFLLKIAEERTWIDSLSAASDNLNRPETFVYILGKLNNYFTTEYDY